MVDEEPKAPERVTLWTIISRWQVLVTAIAAATALWFSLTEHENTQIEINRDAVTYVRSTDFAPRYRADPFNAINELEATFPRRAYCAALGYLIGEQGIGERAQISRAAGAPPLSVVNDSRDAVGAEVAVLIAEAGLRPQEVLAAARDQAEALIVAQTQPAGEGPEEDPTCARLKTAPGLWARVTTARECRLAIDVFAENRCRIAHARWVEEQAAEDQAEAVRLSLASYIPDPADPPTPAEEPDERHGGGSTPRPLRPNPPEPVVEPQPVIEIAPPEPVRATCADIVYVQHAGPAQGAQFVARRLASWSWRVTALDSQPDAKTAGDVRYYYESQRPCAETLAKAASAALAAEGVDVTIQVISLVGRYRDLPEGRMELWLPGF
ncbi:MAG: hypothetical protein AAGE18_18780 [Pseudomonadota bacterium]